MSVSELEKVPANLSQAPKSRVLSGIMPTGDLHIGNYIGAIKNWVAMQYEHDSFFCIVNMHAITTPQDPKELYEKTREVAALYIACGVDPKVSTIFVQSHVPAHTELCWILNCIAPMGWLERMTQFKEKSKGDRERSSVGLFDYPVLQAADILLYGNVPPVPLYVPVGEDQKQHLELARDLAERFNRLFGDTLAIPEPYIPKYGARVMGLDDPTKKMSKSEKSRYHAIRLLDSPDDIRKKIARAVTDPGRDIKFDPERPGLYNLLTIYQAVTGQSEEEIEAHFEGKGYADLKRELAERLVEYLAPLQERYRDIRQDPSYLENVLAQGAERARETSAVVLNAVKKAVGLE
ncbi:tryptophanyl-tRNA synthetase [Thermobaculum terrenum ATCC BAA-798]|uniref:Tryptophan--tRNA ligase n=1 Tax=Thermobaculum terrenum (strain ATCC BAA-798 / CCMEE 7001 / YNP1) TaxID=525904 RepID=D1CBJ5_THET1|nr:tryptophan--tRNA ligase [Thermobaculum terrenum]ACZ42160.1 tryptophanyl-tRNA synthetase [Thermobaculum terrenum ATCC BAA-798]